VNEAKKIGLPMIGLVNSDCVFEIDYPIFAQDHTLHSIYFFCNFLATLIGKETIYTQHKRYTLQKAKKHKKTKPTTFIQEKRSLKPRALQEKRKSDDKSFFFQMILPNTQKLED
jgi:ribosomal protein S2